MILKRAAAYILAVVFLFQALCPSWTFRPQRWRSMMCGLGCLGGGKDRHRFGLLRGAGGGREDGIC